MATKQPVTDSGWYELEDGGVQRFTWRNGVLVAGEKVASWADVTQRDYSADDRASRE